MTAGDHRFCVYYMYRKKVTYIGCLTFYWHKVFLITFKVFDVIYWNLKEIIGNHSKCWKCPPLPSRQAEMCRFMLWKVFNLDMFCGKVFCSEASSLFFTSCTAASGISWWPPLWTSNNVIVFFSSYTELVNFAGIFRPPYRLINCLWHAFIDLVLHLYNKYAMFNGVRVHISR